MGRTGRGRSAPAHLGYCDGDEGGPRRRLRADPFGLRAHPLRQPRQRDQPGTRALEAGGPLSWGEGLSLTADQDMLADEPEPSRAPNHLPSRHDDGAATAKLHQVDLLIAGAEQQEVRDPEVESHVLSGVSDWSVSSYVSRFASAGASCFSGRGSTSGGSCSPFLNACKPLPRWPIISGRRPGPKTTRTITNTTSSSPKPMPNMGTQHRSAPCQPQRLIILWPDRFRHRGTPPLQRKRQRPRRTG